MISSGQIDNCLFCEWFSSVDKNKVNPKPFPILLTIYYIFFVSAGSPIAQFPWGPHSKRSKVDLCLWMTQGLGINKVCFGSSSQQFYTAMDGNNQQF